MAIYQDENEFNVTPCSDEDNIIERIISDKKCKNQGKDDDFDWTITAH